MTSTRLLRTLWTISMLGLGVVLIFFAFKSDFSVAAHFSGSPMLYLIIALVAFMAEYVDSSLGMGYGTTLTPLLIIFGYSPLQIVPAVLLSEFISGTTSGLLHHRLGNVDLSRGSPARKTTSILAACSVVGTVVAVLLAVSLPKEIVKTYIGVMILGIGLYILLARSHARISLGKIVGLGSIAAFNKGISGGGYGPVVTGGQILAGVPEKNAVGITSFAEGIVCLVGLGLYLLLGKGMHWGLALPLAIGAIVSVPAAAWTVKIMPARLLRRAIGYATVFLGVLTLVRVVL